jgi:hypothetical protein
MAAFEDMFKGSNLWVGVGIALAAPVVLPVIGGLIRPIAKTAIGGSLAAADAVAAVSKGTVNRVGELMSSTWEDARDLVAEARHEYETGVGWFSRSGHEAPAPAGERPQA